MHVVQSHRNEDEKRHTYEKQIHKVDRGNFTSLVFSSLGSMGRAATVVYQHLTSLLSKKLKSYLLTTGCLQCSLGFSLLGSSLMYLHGSLSSFSSPGVPVAVALITVEGHLAPDHD